MSRTENPDPRDGVPDAEAAGRARLPRTAGPASAGPPRRRAAASPAGNSCVPEIAPPRIVAVTRATAAIGLIALLIVLLV